MNETFFVVEIYKMSSLTSSGLMCRQRFALCKRTCVMMDGDILSDAPKCSRRWAVNVRYMVLSLGGLFAVCWLGIL